MATTLQTNISNVSPFPWLSITKNYKLIAKITISILVALQLVPFSNIWRILQAEVQLLDMNLEGLPPVAD